MTTLTSGKAHHDPKPWVNYGEDGIPNAYGRHPRYSDCSALCRYEPRPKFDNHNPILVEFRKGVTVDPERDWTEIFLSTLPEWDSGEVGHARRVLSKLAALTTTTNGVTD